MTTIIRIEHKSGKGIFRARINRRGDCLDDKFKWADKLFDRHSDFPTPYRDSLINRPIEEDEFCAFKSIEQLQEWITKDEIKKLSKHNFKVLIIDVSECIVGEYQILYKKTDIIQSGDITSLFID